MSFSDFIWIALLALIVEGLVGYPDRLFRVIGHPVTWIGRLITFGERKLNLPALPADTRRARGAWLMMALLWLVGLIALALAFALSNSLWGLALTGVLASSLIAQRSLHRHVQDVAEALGRSLEEGRASVANIVGRDVSALDAEGVARAAIESLAENFSDGVVAPTFWLALLGLPGGALYKVINTADSMIGHKTKRYRSFGYFAARIDDFANWPAARIAGFLIVAAAALGRKTSLPGAWTAMRRDAAKHVSPNAGWPEAAMAGALGVRLGGPRVYAGGAIKAAWLGDRDAIVDGDMILSALAVYRRALALQFIALALIALALL